MIIKEEFDKRVIEINIHFEIMACLELDKPRLVAFDSEKEETKQFIFDSKSINIFRSNSYLLLYNLIESTIYNSIVSIFDAIKDGNVKYFEMITEVQKYWLNNLYKHDEKKKKETIIETFMSIATQIFNNSIELASNEINYGGSLDAPTIMATAKSMKIQIGNVHRIYNKDLHGESLSDIRRKRNWLAHGEKSFSEVGGDITFKQIDDSRLHVIAFLKEFIISVEDYIEKEEYKQKVNGILA